MLLSPPRQWFRSIAAVVPVVLALSVLLAGCTTGEQANGLPQPSQIGVGGPATTLRPQYPRDLVPYGGLGTWIDVFDYAPNYTEGSPAITPADLSEMARRGVKTIYLQATRWDEESPDGIVDEKLLGEFLTQAHALDMRVVGWYLPDFKDVDRDVARTMQIVDFRAGEQQFDGIAADIEYTQGEPDPQKRNEALVLYSRKVRSKIGDTPLAAVTLTAVHLEVINKRFWPDFPYAKLAGIYDVWMPMAYWSQRTEKYRDGYQYVKESVDRLRNNLGKPDAVVAPVGGIADEITNDDIRAYARALFDVGAIGGSLYDWGTLAPNQQFLMQRQFIDGPGAKLPAPPAVGPHPVFTEADLTTTSTTTTAPPTTTTTLVATTTVVPDPGAGPAAPSSTEPPAPTTTVPPPG
ncbi:MAG: hypothetical protein HYX32_01255 [Actinobacteria bacterium]|nr:hypothetical protein [Actinomycetota bacterium]